MLRVGSGDEGRDDVVRGAAGHYGGRCGLSRSGDARVARALMPSVRGIVRERAAQGTVEDALTGLALLALILGMAALWSVAVRGWLAVAAVKAASHGLEGDGYVDIALYGAVLGIPCTGDGRWRCALRMREGPRGLRAIMRTGFRCGNRRRRGRCGAGILPPSGKRVGMDLFIEDGAYTTVASACAMLMVLSLLFSSSLAIWSASRAADVQVGADATALAGENVVSSYHTAATVLDACALSLGLAGFTMTGAGMVGLFVPGGATALAGENVVSSYHTAATVLDACALSLGLAGFTMTGAGMVGLFVPGGQGLARETLDAAMRVFDMRDSFISSASSGLKRVEGSLPFLIAANAARTCDAQGSESVGYRGTAFAVPTTSASEFPAIEGEGIDTEGLEQACSGLEEKAAELERISDEVAARKEEAWLADCGAPGRNMQERAGSLSGLSAAENPDFASSITWDPEFITWDPEFALARARAYYRWRCENDKPEGSSVEARADAAARRAFYRYALGHLDGARVVDDGEEAYTTLEFLPCNSDDVRGTLLYTEEAWPTSMEAHGRTLHFDESCPGSRGTLGAPASLASLDNGAILECPTCRFGVDDLGRAPAASTSIDNGFEYHLRAFTKALRDYLEAKGRQNEAEAAARGDAEQAADAFDQAMTTLEGKRPRAFTKALRDYLEAKGRQNEAEAAARGDAEQAADAFDQAMTTLEGKRPRIAPPGRFGCVSFVLSSEYSTPNALETSFAASPDVSRRGAMAAAVLAPDGISEGGGVLSGFFSSLQERVGSNGVAGLMDGVLDLWGKMLVSYGDAGRGLEEAFDELMRGLDSQGLGSVGSWLGERLTGVVRALDMQVSYGDAGRGLEEAFDELMRGLDSQGLGSVGSWLGERLTGVVRALDMQSVDMRPRKPVLVDSSDVLARSDVPALADGQTALRELSKVDLDFEGMARAVGYDLGERMTSLEITLAEVRLPSGRVVPITLRVRDLLEGRGMGDVGAEGGRVRRKGPGNS